MVKESKKVAEVKCKTSAGCGPSGAVYGLGFIGAAIYFIGKATTFWAGVLGFFKAMVWPAFLVYEALKYLKI
ncbi:MAG: hypothetical protein V1660_02540 [archaeon]